MVSVRTPPACLMKKLSPLSEYNRNCPCWCVLLRSNNLLSGSPPRHSGEACLTVSRFPNRRGSAPILKSFGSRWLRKTYHHPLLNLLTPDAEPCISAYRTFGRIASSREALKPVIRQECISTSTRDCIIRNWKTENCLRPGTELGRHLRFRSPR